MEEGTIEIIANIFSVISTVAAVGYTTIALRSHNQKQKIGKMFLKQARENTTKVVKLLMPTLKDQLALFVKVPNTAEIRASHGISRAAKLEMWNRMKSQVFARSIISTYSVVYLANFIQVAVNLSTRYAYIDQTLHAKNKKEILTTSTQKAFISHVDYLLNTGLKAMAQRIEKIVGDVLQNYPLQEKFKFTDVKDIFRKVCQRAEECPSTQKNPYAQYLLPSVTSLDKNLNQITRGSEEKNIALLLRETRTIFDSTSFADMFAQNLEDAFSWMLHKISLILGDSETLMVNLITHIRKAFNHIMDGPEFVNFVLSNPTFSRYSVKVLRAET